jgi:hypothetical protein
MEAGADVIATDGVNGEGFASVSGFMGEDLNAGGSKWGLVKVEMSVSLGVCREFRIDPRGSEEVESQDCLWDKFVP